MSEEVKISKKVFGKNGFINAVDVTFNQFSVTPSSVSQSALIGVQDFFLYYNELFYDIPMSGSFSGSLGLSHLDLVNRSSDYIGISLTDMQQEILNLRNENIGLQRQIFVLTQSSGSI